MALWQSVAFICANVVLLMCADLILNNILNQSQETDRPNQETDRLTGKTEGRSRQMEFIQGTQF